MLYVLAEYCGCVCFLISFVRVSDLLSVFSLCVLFRLVLRSDTYDTVTRPHGTSPECIVIHQTLAVHHVLNVLF